MMKKKKSKTNNVISLQEAREKLDAQRKKEDMSENDRNLLDKKLKKLEDVKESLIVSLIEESENGIADLFVHFLGGMFCYDHRAKKWMRWNNHYWVDDETNSVLHCIDGLIVVLKKEYVKIDKIYNDYKTATEDSPNYYFKIEYNTILGHIDSTITFLRILRN